MSKSIIAENFEFPRKRTEEEKKQRRREKVREYSKKSTSKYISRGSCRACGGVKENQELQHCNKCRRRVRSNTFKHIYGITIDEYEELLAYQNFVCSICEKEETSKNGNLHIDHCHKTNIIRGLLCGKCNKGLGAFGDSPELLERAVQYLKTAIE